MRTQPSTGALLPVYQHLKESEPKKIPFTKSNKVYDFSEFDTLENYKYLDSDFDEQIDETPFNPENKEFREVSFSKIKNELVSVIKTGRAATMVQDSTIENQSLPLFIENTQVLIISLENPGQINRPKLENILTRLLEQKLTVVPSEINLEWENHEINNEQLRRLKLPWLGSFFFYFLKKNEQIFCDDEALLNEILSQNSEDIEKIEGNFENYTVLRLTEREQNFDQIFQTLKEKDPFSKKTDFFTDNIGSLLDVLSVVQKVEIKSDSNGPFLFEEISFVLK